MNTAHDSKKTERLERIMKGTFTLFQWAGKLQSGLHVAALPFRRPRTLWLIFSAFKCEIILAEILHSESCSCPCPPGSRTSKNSRVNHFAHYSVIRNLDCILTVTKSGWISPDWNAEMLAWLPKLRRHLSMSFWQQIPLCDGILRLIVLIPHSNAAWRPFLED